MPLFDFSGNTAAGKDPVCTYTVFFSNARDASPERPILIIDNSATAFSQIRSGEHLLNSKRMGEICRRIF